jgi:hypothetical protein
MGDRGGAVTVVATGRKVEQQGSSSTLSSPTTVAVDSSLVNSNLPIQPHS